MISKIDRASAMSRRFDKALASARFFEQRREHETKSNAHATRAAPRQSAAAPRARPAVASVVRRVSPDSVRRETSPVVLVCRELAAASQAIHPAAGPGVKEPPVAAVKESPGRAEQKAPPLAGPEGPVVRACRRLAAETMGTSNRRIEQ